MKYNILFVLVSGLLLFYSCTELQDDLPQPVVSGVTVHPQSWMDTAQGNFHGKYIKSKNWNSGECKRCHGGTYQGGKSGIPCGSCHPTYPHGSGWFGDTSLTAFHGKYVKLQNWNMDGCRLCHGESFIGGASEVSCYQCHETFPHISGWESDTTQPFFHGKYLKTQNWNDAGCKPCHGTSLDGGSSGVSCTSCHNTFPHVAGWNVESNATFHGKFLKAQNWNMTGCTSCHGETYQGGTSGVSCYTCHATFPHVSDWDDSTTVDFHGSYLKLRNWNVTSCKNCHGNSFTGGTSEIACYTCHSQFPHPDGWEESSPTIDPNFHGLFLQTNNWNLTACQDCHGTTYLGSNRVPISCSTSGCHEDVAQTPKTPEACNTCHGNFRASANDTISWAPPRTLSGDTLRTIAGVGAHRQHLVPDSLGNIVKCRECHSVPSTTFVSGHVDSPLPVEVLFNDSLAGLPSGDGTLVPNPSYNTSNNKCDNTFCHGNWRLKKDSAPTNLKFAYTDSVMVGLNSSPLWTGTSSEVACGTCHGLPPQGHLGASVVACVSCHGDVTDNTGKIVNKAKHINGKIDLTSGFGGQRNFR
jgi:DnaJ-class molecular chaperone